MITVIAVTFTLTLIVTLVMTIVGVSGSVLTGQSMIITAKTVITLVKTKPVLAATIIEIVMPPYTSSIMRVSGRERLTDRSVNLLHNGP